MKRALSVLWLMAACAVQDEVPPATQIRNTCSGSCQGFGSGVSCTGDGEVGCQFLRGSPPPGALIYAVSAPAGPSSYSGVSFAAQEPFNLRECNPSSSKRGYCTGSLLAYGAYWVRYDTLKGAGIFLGPEPTGTNKGYSIPVRAEFRPMMGTNRVQNGRGVPVSTSLAVPLTITSAVYQLQGVPRTLGGNPAVGWVAPLVSTNYDISLYPEPPFDQLLPPYFSFPSENSQPNESSQLNVGDSLPYEVRIDSVVDRTYQIDSGREDFTGWTAKIVSDVKIFEGGRRISSLQQLHTGFNTVRLLTATEKKLLPDGAELVIEPPNHAPPRPRYIIESPGGNFPHVPLVYPPFPPPVTVTGRIINAEQETRTGVPARLLFRTQQKSGALTTLDSVSYLLRYEQTVETNDAGDYSASLFEGDYDVVVTPRAPNPHLLSTGVLAKAFHPAKGDSTRTIGGQSLEVHARRQFKGSVALADGRVLSGIEVEAHPAANPENATDDQVRLVQSYLSPVATFTDESGKFSLPADAGSYDLVIRPPSGSGFPWTMFASKGGESGMLLSKTLSTSDDLDLGQIVVPAPNLDAFFVQFVPAGQSLPVPIRNAFVRAYWVPPGQARAVEVARADADAQGYVRLLLDPLLFPNE